MTSSDLPKKYTPSHKESIWSAKHLALLISFPSIILLVGVLIFLLANGELDRVDYWKSQSALFIETNHYLSSWSSFWFNTTQLGDALIFFPLVSFLIIWRPQAWAAMLAAVPLATFLAVGGKHLAAIPRPAAILDHNFFTIIGNTLTAHNSLPSGHTITAFAIITAILGSLIPFPSQKSHWLWWLLGLLLAATIALSRIAVGAHWPIDIIVGALFGYIAGISGVFLTQRYKRWWGWLCIPKYHFIFGFILMAWSILLISKITEFSDDNIPIYWLAILSSSTSSLYLLKSLFYYSKPLN